MPERRRLLGPRHRDVHDPRRHVHAAVRLLQREDRQADVERPARAGPRRALGRAHGAAPRGHHERRPRRPARLRRVRVRRRHPPDPPPGAALPGRGADPRLPRRRRCRSRRSSPSGPTSSTTTSRSCPRLYPIARRGSKFLRSCRVLRNAKEMGGDEVTTKSGLMVGLGETHDELVETFGVLREHGVQVLTVGQYLRPTENHLPVVRYWHPDEFAALERGRLRPRLRARRRRAARALELPRRPARAPARARDRPARRRA